MINEQNARIYSKDDISKIENYQEAVADKHEVWDIHHRRETDEGLSKRELLRRKEYFHRPSSELIFLTRREHKRLHGLNLQEETRKKISQANLGKKYALGYHHTSTAKKRIAAASLGNKHTLGYHWYHNSVESVFAKSCPPGFVKGRKSFLN